MAALPSGRRSSPDLSGCLRAIVAYNESVYGWDKTNKNLSYGLPLLSTVLQQLFGDGKHLVLRGLPLYASGTQPLCSQEDHRMLGAGHGFVVF
jgi:hypothetical protein